MAEATGSDGIDVVDGVNKASAGKDGAHLAAKKGKGMTRGRFLAGVAGFVGLAATGGVALEDTTGAVSRIFAPDIENIPREIPPQLQGKEIPDHNEHYRSPLDIVRGALDEYVKDGGKPFYKKPDYYLTQWEAAKTFGAGGFDLGFDTTGKPYDKALKFGAMSFDYVDTIYESDPGTSVKKEVDRRLATIPDPDASIIENGTLGTATKKQRIIAQTYAEQFNRTKKTIDQIRGEGRVSTAELLKYFLKNSNGDIVQSLWDTSMFLKLAARVDIDGMANVEQWRDGNDVHVYQADRSGAELISSMFHDDFSSEIPLEWLVGAVSPEDKILNSDDPKANQQWKDFMPVNRDGTPYHVYNLAAWAAVMSPSLVEEFTTAYYSSDTKRYPTVGQQGRIKVRADFTAARQAKDLRTLFDRYRI